MTRDKRTAVVYLARKAEGLEPLRRFTHSYRLYPAGEPHDLIVIYKGFNDAAEAAESSQMFAALGPTAQYVDDSGIDITAYLRATELLDHEEICFLNTFSEPQDVNWLSKLLNNLRREGVGVVGATGSYESLHSSMDLLSKVIWLCAAKDIEWDEHLARHYLWVLKSQFPSWLNKSPRSKLTRRLMAILSSPRDYTSYDNEYARHWDAITQQNGPIEWASLFPKFPNPHIRSNCFAIKRERLLSLRFPKVITKMEGCRFESGFDSLTARIRHEGLLALVVGKDGIGYDVKDWPTSRTFRLGTQDNVLVTDNQIRNFNNYSPEERATHILMTWGGYVDRKETAAVPVLGKDFSASYREQAG